MIASIRKCLACVVERLNETSGHIDDETFTVRESGITRIIPLKDILFFETSPKKHHIILHTDCERIEFTGKLQEISHKLPDCFLRTHRSYLVNIAKIKGVDYKMRELTLINGQTCLFSRNMRSQIQLTV